MKFSTSIVTVALFLTGANAFAPSTVGPSSTALNADRRSVLSTLATSTGAILTATIASSAIPTPAYALGQPTYENMKLIYDLGVSLDKLKVKVIDPDTSEAALVGIRSFNKDPNFYTGYARNFISKSVKNNADGDVRVGYIRQASSIIGSIQELLEGRQGLFGADAAKEAGVRVDKAQALIGKFLAECGIDSEKEKFEAYVSKHPY